MKKLEHLIKPIQVRNMVIPNRVVMPPMGTFLGNDDGTVSEASLAYLKRRVMGGAGLIVQEITAIHPDGATSPSQLGIYEDRFMPGLRKVTQTVHDLGSKIIVQLHHAGRESLYQLQKGTAVAPSAIPSMVFKQTPREMTKEDIQEIINAFGDGAVRAREAGYDGVELHAAHGYLLAQFLSIHANQRKDQYGGDIVQRSRFIIEVLDEVRRRVGDDYPISIRLSVDEWIKGGYTPEDMQLVVPELVRHGCDMISASFGTHGSPAGITQAPIEYEQGFNVGLARKMKEVVDVPVVGVGRFTDPFFADECIARGDADLIAFGRQHLADPDYLKKAVEGRAEETIECLACNQGCFERLLIENGSIRCAINPETGQELIYPAGPAETSRTVWGIGGGPGGLTAAYEAARLGHKVTLFEKGPEVGGQVRYAAMAPYKDPYGKWINGLAKRTEKLGVKINTGTEVTEAMIRQEKPEAVILATGGRQVPPEIDGRNLPHVTNAYDILAGRTAPGKHILIVGGGLVGMETADYLIALGCTDITLVEQLRRSPVLKLTSHGYMLHSRLKKAGCKMLFNTKLTRIDKDDVTVVIDDKEQILAPVDQVVIATGTGSNAELENVLKETGISYKVVGDAAEVRRIVEATDEGAKAAWAL
ncbi:MAG: FAD-dependent oxidoreductase [Syntrophomonadaceae bacterium]|nr:FAD-dependent oxidoreductase [Syntrophomonadaceae bacterium]